VSTVNILPQGYSREVMVPSCFTLVLSSKLLSILIKPGLKMAGLVIEPDVFYAVGLCRRQLNGPHGHCYRNLRRRLISDRSLKTIQTLQVP